MATISVTIPTAVEARVMDAFAKAYQFDPEAGQTKAQFAKAVVARFIKETVAAVEAQAAAETAGKAAKAAADSELSIT